MPVDYHQVPSPSFVLDEAKLRHNLTLIKQVADRSGAEVILAFKGFSMWSAFPVVREFIRGATASSLNEAKLCNEEMGVKSHTYGVAYEPGEFEELLSLSSHLTFNSLNQYQHFYKIAKGKASLGLRVNPEWSDVQTELYNPASSSSRLGITSDQFPDELPEGIEGLHFHVLCESDSRALEKVLEHFESKFGKYLNQIKWVNFGGGHLMTKEGYDIDHLVNLLRNFKNKYGVRLILEPGSAFAWQTGDLVTTVLDIVENGGTKTAILNASFTCHMPDTLEMPYRPEILGGSAEANQYPNKYRLGGVSCLAGDFLEEYSFEKPINIGDKLILKDMIHYTMVKTSMFNGVHHPSIGIWSDQGFNLVRKFNYDDFKSRLS